MQIKVDNYILKFIGIFEYQQSDIDNEFTNEKAYEDWLDDKKEGLFKDYFYPNYNAAIFQSKTNNEIARKLKKNASIKASLIRNEKEYQFEINAIDMFFFKEILNFSNNTRFGMFALDLKLNNCDSAEEIAYFVSMFREYEKAGITIKNCKNSINESTLSFLKEFVFFKINSGDAKLISGNKMKVYQIFDVKDTISEDDLTGLLYDIGCTVPIGSAKGEKKDFEPSKEYYEELIRDNSFSVFKNWKAMALFDTFTVIGNSLQNKMDTTFKETYFNIYVHALHFKYYLFNINFLIKNPTDLKDKNNSRRNYYFEFISDNYFHNISYNFLPNIIIKKMYHALNIPLEVEILQKKINIYDDIIQEETQKMQKKILLFIAILGISQAIWDSSEYIKSMFFSDNSRFYPIGGGIIALLTLVLFAGIIIKSLSEDKYKKINFKK